MAFGALVVVVAGSLLTASVILSFLHDFAQGSVRLEGPTMVSVPFDAPVAPLFQGGGNRDDRGWCNRRRG